jgi:hypothetical protein
MDLQEWDDVILGGRFPLLSSFLNGLEPEFRPVARDPHPLNEEADDFVPTPD